MRRKTLLITVGACGTALGIALAIISLAATSPRREGRYQHGSLSIGHDAYNYAVYVPSSRRAGSTVPLMVVLHGCSTTADQMAAASQYNATAERDRFIVLYPDVDALDEGNGRCWRGIWAPNRERRGVGDAGAIAEMTRAVMARWRADRNRVYAIGISAGAFETAILGAYYPDLYAAIGIHSGAAFMRGAPGCLDPSQKPADTGGLARVALAAMGTLARVMPVIVVHGDVDDTIPYRCGQQAISQWLRADSLLLEREGRPGLPESPTAVRSAVVPSGRAYTVRSYADRSGCTVAQLWTIHGMGHFWSGGSTDPSSARYSDPRGPSAAAASSAFFSRWGLSGPLHPCAEVGH